jgi:putative membrane protein
MLRVTLAWLHLLALGIGLGAVLDRAAALRDQSGPASLNRAFRDDTAWGIAAVVWIGTGLWRLLAATEKSTSYYLHNRFFMAKMALLVVILALEIWPMVTLIRWRIAAAQQRLSDITARADTARRVAMISTVQAVLVAAMILFAAAMARGYGATN